MTAAWVVRAGRHGERENAVLRDGLVIVGWPEVGDLSRFGTRADLRAEMARIYPNHRAAVVANWTGQLWRFVDQIREGDLVVVPLKTREGRLAVGRMTGEYHYRADAPEGFRHVRAVEWLRTDLPRAAAAPDLANSLGSLLTVFQLARHDAARRVAELAANGVDPGRDPSELGGAYASRDDLLQQAADESAAVAPRLTIRELLAMWGAGRRTAEVVARIESDLSERGLTTRPPFTAGWIDNIVELVRLGEEPDESTPPMEPADSPATAAASVSLRVADLESANNGALSVDEDTTLAAAATMMLQHRYSQLAVRTSGGGVRAVSWESIAKAFLAKPDPALADATVAARVVERDGDLLAHIDEIYTVGYVFVSDGGSLVGIITAADLTQQFGTMARPLALIEECERRLRRRVDEVFTLDEIKMFSKKPQQTFSAADLTFGNYEHALKPVDRFVRLGWRLDQHLFLDQLTQVRMIRNELAHFSTDPLTVDQLRSIDGLVNMLRTVDPRA